MKEPLMLPAMTSADDNDKEEIISSLAKKLVHILDNDLEDELNNNLLMANKQLSICDEEHDNNEESVAETKEVVPVDKKLINVMKNLIHHIMRKLKKLL